MGGGRAESSMASTTAYARMLSRNVSGFLNRSAQSDAVVYTKYATETMGWSDYKNGAVVVNT